MGYTYATFKTALATELAVGENDADFLAIFPTLIDDAEQRCYRELNPLYSVVTLTGTVTANNRSFTLPTGSGHILLVLNVNILDASNIRHPVVPATRHVVDYLWPSNTAANASTIPTLFSRVDDTSILFGPPPGDNFSIEVVATIRPEPLSVSNTTTYLSLYLSDLFFASAMVSASAFMRNFGSQSDDPKMAQSWENQFQMRLLSARTEEISKKYMSMATVGSGRNK